MKAKGWQIALIVAGFVACAVSVLWIMRDDGSAHINHVLHYVDAETGDIYRVDITKHNIGAPGRNPDTGRMSLVRLDKRDSGDWFVNPHDRSTIHMLDKGVVNNAIDEKTGELRLPAKPPVEYVRKS